MHTGTAPAAPISTIDERRQARWRERADHRKRTIAPIITTSPWAKLMSWMMP